MPRVDDDVSGAKNINNGSSRASKELAHAAEQKNHDALPKGQMKREHCVEKGKFMVKINQLRRNRPV